MTNQLPIFAQKRYEICKQCEFYNKNDTCQILVRKGKAGQLFHERGIGNKRTRCPKRFFLSIKSLHSILISLFIRGLSENESHYWTTNRVSPNTVLEALHSLFLPEKMKRSEIKVRLESIMKYANDYQNPSIAVKEMISLHGEPEDIPNPPSQK